MNSNCMIIIFNLVLYIWRKQKYIYLFGIHFKARLHNFLRFSHGEMITDWEDIPSITGDKKKKKSQKVPASRLLAE